MEQLTLEEMNQFAKVAESELVAMVESSDEPSASEVGRWWRKWYLKCGHKRLGRLVLQYLAE